MNVRDSPLRDLRVVLSQCAHVVVPDGEDSFEFDPEDELDIEADDDGDSDEVDDDYVPEGGSGGSGGEGGEIQEEGIGTIQRGVGKMHKKGLGKIQKEGAGEIQKGGRQSSLKGVGAIQEGGWGKFRRKGRVQGWVRECGDPRENLVPRLPGVHIKAKMPSQTTHHAKGMVE